MKNIIINLLLILIFSCTFAEDTPKTEEKSDSPEPTYTMTYKSDYGTVPSKISGLKKGDILTAEQLPELTTDGYTFAGWYNGENEVTTEYKITGDMELTAKWNVNTYTITYNLADGTNAESNPASYTVETKTIILANATRTGYTFAGWYTDETCTITKTKITKGSTGNIMLYAKWTANKAGITVILPNSNDAQIALQQVTSENTVTFTAADDFGSYAWYIDGVKQSEKSKTFIIDTSTMNPIIYKIMVMVSKDGKYYSATADLKIDREQ